MTSRDANGLKLILGQGELDLTPEKTGLRCFSDTVRGVVRRDVQVTRFYEGNREVTCVRVIPVLGADVNLIEDVSSYPAQASIDKAAVTSFIVPELC